VDCFKCHSRFVAGEKSGSDLESRTHIRYTGLQYANCTPCHEDKHQQRLGDDCERCHTTAGWSRKDNRGFDHNRTIYPLEGRHDTVECRRCHTGERLTTPVAHGLCTDCHADAHRAQFADRPDGGRCEGCHGLEGFIPARFDLPEHQQGPYPLTGAHTALPCIDCHRMEALRGTEPVRRFRMAESACHDCHPDEHRGQFPPRLGEPWCETCHSTAVWRDVEIDHGLTRFPLTGSHGRTACTKCHPRVEAGTGREHTRFKPLETGCLSCHDDIHRGQFTTGEQPKDCTACHTPNAWAELRFEHNRDSRYTLRGAHHRIACGECHPREGADGIDDGFIRYRPLASDCAHCHK